MERKGKYKHIAFSVNVLKDKQRSEVISLRKTKRDKWIRAKRFRLDEGLSDDVDQMFTVQLVTSSTKALQYGSTNKFEDLQILRQALSQGSLYVEAFFKVENALPCLVGLLTDHDLKIQDQAVACFTNICAEKHDHAMAVAKTAAPYLITFLSSNSRTLQDYSAWALGNLAGDGPACRDLLFKQGIVLPLVSEIVAAGILDCIPQYLHLKPDNRNILAQISWILACLSTSGEFVPSLIEQGILTTIITMLVQLASEQPHDPEDQKIEDHFNPKVGDLRLRCTAAALANKVGVQQVRMRLDQDMMSDLPSVKLIVLPLLQCLGNMCSWLDEHSLLACENPQLEHTLGQYLNSSIRDIVKETLWVFFNIAAVPSFATRMVYSPLLIVLIEKLNGGFGIQKQALCVLNNLARPDTCNCLLEHKVLQTVIPVLKSHDVEILNSCLALCKMILRHTEGGSHIFEKFGGVARLEGLEYHSNTTVVEKANQLLEKYFLINQEEGED